MTDTSAATNAAADTTSPTVHFIRRIIDHDLQQPSVPFAHIITRFPPEPNGYLHIGHAKSICLNFGLAEQYQGHCHLRFDDTNPEKESQEYIDAIQKDVRWMGFEWTGPVRYASDYFQRLYECAVELIGLGYAYVCDLTPQQMKDYRGTLTEPGKNSPYRERSVEENLRLFEEMKSGQHAEGSRVLRAKIDMSSGNINMRDPIIYRIRFASHHQTADQWCIYPMYDYTHCISDALEGITHSLCTLEFEDHRPLYDWVLNILRAQMPFNYLPQQIEFARLNLNFTITSKRKLKQLVDEHLVSGWDDPRMLTISGLRRRGVSARALRQFCQAIGISKADSVVDMGMLEFAIRDDWDKHAPRALCVLRPLKVTLTNYPAEQVESLSLSRHPKDSAMGQRIVPFSQTLWIDQQDFMQTPPKDYFRLSPGQEVRLRGAYVIRCEEAITDASGQVIELRCTYDADTLGKNPVGRKVKGVIHWVSAAHAKPCQVRLYDRLFAVSDPEASAEADGKNFTDFMNPESCQVINTALMEPALIEALSADDLTAEQPTVWQFEREGYFALDQVDSKPNHWVFNRTVTLKDTWAKHSG
jgi:glutaminyl-tRNA synthetase